MNIPKSGNITFLFTDIEGSTKLAQEFPDKLQTALERHHHIMREAIEYHNGFIFEIVGDAFCSSFDNTADAVNAAKKAQHDLIAEKWDELNIKVRMGIHSGNAEWNGKRYMGYITLARVQRVMSAAYGGQVLISGDAYSLIKGRNGNIINYLDLGNRRLKDLIEPVQLYQLTADDLPADFPPLKTLDARANNLPFQLTNFIGRGIEIIKVKNLLKENRLLTLIGPGGVGKTRLALQSSADLIDNFTNGVWLAELADIQDGTLLPEAIMGILGVKETHGSSVENSLCSYLKDKETLIIFDNCEHIINSAANLIEKLLKNASNLKILATSRETLKCSGEQIHMVAFMETPGSKDITPDELAECESGRLFIERALLIKPDFRISESNVKFLADICRKLEGIPLAIELAAAKLKILSPEKLNERLDDRFNLLKAAVRTALPKQQTLQSMIDWSYDLLSDQEKMLWVRLSLFNGGWTLEAAEEICTGGILNKTEILELLNLLTEKSIISFNEEEDRYQMLEMIKQYGNGKLYSFENVDSLLWNHLRFYQKLATTGSNKFSGPDIKMYLDRFQTEHGNFERALKFALKIGECEEGLILAGALGEYWFMRGYLSRGKYWLENILDKNVQYKGVPKIKVMYLAGILTFTTGEPQKAEQIFLEGLKAAKENNIEKYIPNFIGCLGNIYFLKGDYELAKQYYKEEFTEKKSLERAIVLNNLGNVEMFQGNLEKAFELYSESLSIEQERGSKMGIYRALINLGKIMFHIGNFDKAKEFLKEGEVLAKEIGPMPTDSSAFTLKGNLEFEFGNYEKARDFFSQELEISRSTGNVGDIGISMYHIGFALLKLKEFSKASELFKESLKICTKVEYNKEILINLLGTAYILTFTNCYSKASILIGKVTAMMEKMNAVFLGFEKSSYAEMMDKLKNNISAEDFRKYFNEGKHKTLDEVVEMSLTDLPEK